MWLRRAGRRRLSWVLTVGLLLMQWAVAGYACPRVSAATHEGVDVAMPDCAGMAAGAMDPDQPQLCKAHCDQAHQAVHTGPGVDVDAPALMWLLVDSHPARTFARADAAPPASVHRHGHAPPGAPPIYIAFRVLRR